MENPQYSSRLLFDRRQYSHWIKKMKPNKKEQKFVWIPKVTKKMYKNSEKQTKKEDKTTSIKKLSQASHVFSF